MKKLLGRIEICLLLAAMIWTGTLLADRQKLNRDVIRLHVVANSDSRQDQDLKLLVRDAVLESLRQDLHAVSDTGQARVYLENALPRICKVAQSTLRNLGCKDAVTVSLCREAFEKRIYDTFSLPAGVYEALRIVIGDGEGKNWWCVVFPSLCLPQEPETFADVAAASGFSGPLRESLSGSEKYELRFAALDILGKLENMLFAG